MTLSEDLKIGREMYNLDVRLCAVNCVARFHSDPQILRAAEYVYAFHKVLGKRWHWEGTTLFA